MNNRLQKNILIITAWLLIIFSITSVRAVNLSEFIVNYSNFSYVKDISTSLTNIYIATTRGIIRYDHIEEKWLEPLTGNPDIDENNIQYIWSNQFDNKLYVRTTDGFYEYDNFLNRWYRIQEIAERNLNEKHINPPQIMFAPPGHIFSPDGSLIDQYNRDFPFSVFLDDGSGSFWIGMWGNGVATANTSSAVIQLLPYGLLQNSVTFIYNDDGYFWLGGDPPFIGKSGLTFFDPDNNYFEYLENGLESDFPLANINCMSSYNDYYVVGTSEGIYFLDRENLEVERYVTDRRGLPDRNVNAFQTVGDSLFVGTDAGMALITSGGEIIRYYRPDQFLTTKFYDFELVDSSLWIASSAGAYRLNLNSNKLQKFQDPDLFLFGEVFEIKRESSNPNYLWFSSREGALKLDMAASETKTFQSASSSFRKRPIVANSLFTAIASDFSLTFIFHSKDPIIYKELTAEDGLVSNNILSLELDGDFIWIGTDLGLSRFEWKNQIWIE